MPSPSTLAVAAEKAMAKAAASDPAVLGKYPSLFEPVALRGNRIVLPNRFCFLPTYLNMEQRFNPKGSMRDKEGLMEAMSAFYKERAANSCGLIYVGGIAPSWLGAWKKDALQMTGYDTAALLSPIPNAVHREGGKCIVQAFHAGRSAFKKCRVGASTEWNQKVHPFPHIPTVGVPKQLINYIVSEYERFAMLAEHAGFDGIEIPISDGSLLHNFVSKATNTRDDEFGGIHIEQRLEIVRRVLANVKGSLKEPEHFTITARVCVHDLKEDGNTMQDTLSVVDACVRSEIIDLISTSVAMHDSPVQTMAGYVPRGFFGKATKIVRDHIRAAGITDIPVVSSHRVNTMAAAEEFVSTGVCDIVGLCRPLLADPKFIQNVIDDKELETTPCISCNHCINRLYKHQTIACSVNPLCGNEADLALQPAFIKKKIVVVGAGPAGITCALTLAKRGHEVMVFEKEKYIGGQLNYAKLIPGKHEYFMLLEKWVHELRKSDKIHLRFNTTFSYEEIARASFRADSIVMCVGSIFRQPAGYVLMGSEDCPIMCTIPDILSRRVIPGRRVAVIGNGAHAYDLASYLAHDHQVSRKANRYAEEFGVDVENGTLAPQADLNYDTVRNNREIVLMEKPENKGSDLSRGKGWFQRQWIRQHKIDIIDSSHFNYIEKNGIRFSGILGDAAGDYFYECDTMVYCYGMVPNFKDAMFLREYIKDGAVKRGMLQSDFGIYMAGSCREAVQSDGQGEQDLLQAIHEGYEIGSKL